MCFFFLKVYIYQRWIYRVDPTRINEFGTSLNEGNENEKKLSSSESKTTTTTDNGAVKEQILSNEIDNETKKTI